MENERLGEKLMVSYEMFCKAGIDLENGREKTYKIVEKNGCCCLGMKIQMVKAVGVKRVRKKQIIVDNQWNLKTANFMY